MSRSAFDAYTDTLFKNLKILNFENIYKLQIGTFMYQYKSGLLPYSFNGRFYTKDALSVWTNLGKCFVVRLGYASLV